METLARLPKEFLLEDPFSSTHEYIKFDVRLPRPNIYGHYNLAQLYLKTIRLFLATEIRPRLNKWLVLLSTIEGPAVKGVINVPASIERVIENFVNTLNGPEGFPEKMKEEGAISLFSAAQTQFAIPYMVSFLCSHFNAFRKTALFKKIPLSTTTKTLESLAVTELEDNESYQSFLRLAETMFSSWLGFAPALYQAVSIAYVLICKKYQAEIVKTTDGLSLDLLKSVDNGIRSWLSTFAPQSDETEELLIECHRKICQSAITLLADKIYEITISDYPASSETIQTLRYCFAHSENFSRDKILQKLIEKVRCRLLSVEEDTSVILDAYSNCVYSLKELDPSCSFMHRVCGEIREFLKRRPDTVRKIINYITSVKREQLAEHLGRSCGTIIDEEEFRGTNDEFLPEALESYNCEKWMPDPPDAPPGKSSHIRQSADVFNMLISVYGSKEVFVKEYRKLLSERLTSFADKDSQFELRYLEVLKQRFNEGELSQCEVMLKDVEESQKMDIVVAATQSVPITAAIVSSHFWPLPDFDRTMVFPSVLEEGLTFYAEKYCANKLTRRLNWLKSWGWTEIEITVGGTTITKFVSNQHAAVLYLYAEKEAWAPGEVSSRLGITKSTARRRLEWWGNQGLLTQELPNGATSEVWSLIENPTVLNNAERQGEDVSDDEDSAAIEDVADAADALETFWMYTKNFIAQNEAVKAERIHKIFKMFSSPSAQSPSLEVVNTFLFRKVKQNLLTYQSGSFRVVKDAPKSS